MGRRQTFTCTCRFRLQKIRLPKCIPVAWCFRFICILPSLTPTLETKTLNVAFDGGPHIRRLCSIHRMHLQTPHSRFSIHPLLGTTRGGVDVSHRLDSHMQHMLLSAISLLLLSLFFISLFFFSIHCCAQYGGDTQMCHRHGTRYIHTQRVLLSLVSRLNSLSFFPPFCLACLCARSSSGMMEACR